MILLGILLYSLFVILHATPILPEGANYMIETENTGEQVSSTVPLTKEQEYERMINGYMELTRNMTRDLEEFTRADELKKRYQRHLKEDIDYVKIRQNASLGILEEISRNVNNDTEAFNILAKKKQALKLNIRSFELPPFAALGDSFQMSLMAQSLPMQISMAKSIFRQIYDSTDSEKIRDRIDEETDYLDSVEFNSPDTLDVKEKINPRRVTDALQLSEAPETKTKSPKLNKEEQKILEEMRQFKIIYREKLENQIGQSIKTKVHEEIAEVPGVPTSPILVDAHIDETGWIVSWYEKMSDGGSRITNYAVEMRQNDTSEWELAVCDLDGWKLWWRPDRSTRYGNDWEFRVSAANKEDEKDKPSETIISLKSCLKLEERQQREQRVQNETIKALECLMKENAEDLSALVIINENLKTVKSTQSTDVYWYMNQDRIPQNITEEEQRVIKESMIDLIPFDYKNKVKQQIEEHKKKFKSDSNDSVMGFLPNGTLTYYNREKEDTQQISANSSLKDKVFLPFNKFNKLGRDVDEWNQIFFMEFEKLLLQKDNQKIQEIEYLALENVISSFGDLEWPASRWTYAEEDTLKKKYPRKEINFELFDSYLNSRYKVDPFIFMRRLERIEKELKQLAKLTSNLKEDSAYMYWIERTLGTINQRDYTESSLQDKESFDAKFGEADFKVDTTKVVNALKLELANQESIEKDFTMREKIIFNRIKPICQKYKEKLQESFDSFMEGSGNEPADDLYYTFKDVV